MALCDIHVAGCGEHPPAWGLRDDRIPGTDQAVRGGRHGQKLHSGPTPPPPRQGDAAALRMPAAERRPAWHSRRFKGERPIGAATGYQSQPPRPCANPPPPLPDGSGHRVTDATATRLGPFSQRQRDHQEQRSTHLPVDPLEHAVARGGQASRHRCREVCGSFSFFGRRAVRLSRVLTGRGCARVGRRQTRARSASGRQATPAAEPVVCDMWPPLLRGCAGCSLRNTAF